MSETWDAFETKMKSLRFRRNALGIGMECNVAGVKITAVEAPDGIHLLFERITERTAAQFETRVPLASTTQQIAASIVKNLESAFPDIGRTASD
jgi:hypothetical protein